MDTRITCAVLRYTQISIETVIVQDIPGSSLETEGIVQNGIGRNRTEWQIDKNMDIRYLSLQSTCLNSLINIHKTLSVQFLCKDFLILLNTHILL